MVLTDLTRPQRRRPGLNRTLIIVCQSMQTLAFAGVSLFLPLIRDDLHISYSQAGTLAAATTFTYALMQIPAGYLADRVDPKRLFVVGLTVVNLLSISFAALDSYGFLLANQALSGIFRSLVFAKLRSLVSHRVVQLTGVIQFVRLAVATGVSFWLPSLIVEDKGFSLAVAGVVTAIGSGVTAPANFLGGFTVSYGFGVIKDATGSFAPGLWILSGLCLVGLAATWLISRIPAPSEPVAAA